MEVSLIKISSLYSDPDKNGNQKLIKDGILSTIIFDTDEIKTIEQVTDKKGKVKKDACIVYLRGRENPVLLAHPQNELWMLKNIRVEIQGYKAELDKRIKLKNKKKNERKRPSKTNKTK